MANPKFPRGSEWRKWDLHVHTPCSGLGHEFGADFDRYATNFFKLAVEKQIAVVGVTDYFTIEGYQKIKEIQATPKRLIHLVGEEVAEKASRILLLPNIEFRSSIIVDGSRVNFHVIFSDEIDPATINDDFLREIRFTSECGSGQADESWSLTEKSLSELGARLKRQHEKFRDRSDLCVGMMNAVVKHEDVTGALDRQTSRFKDRWVFVVAADEDLSRCSWDGQGHLTRKLFIQKAHMLFSANPQTREWALGRKQPSEMTYEEEFGALKPCVHGSDAHCYLQLFEPAKGRQLWIKADPTFLGLRQIIHEPESRVHIGDAPTAIGRIREESTKYMCEVRFERTGEAKASAVWFSGSLELNPGLIAIIGNKGSGKSALADVLGLLGETRAASHFSFLDRKHFLNPKQRLGAMFRANVRWYSGSEFSRTLSHPADPAKQEIVKYIPQEYLETVCSELSKTEESRFYRELMEVIFSHVSEADRLEKESLPELIRFLTSEKESKISRLESELYEMNASIVELEGRLTGEYRKSLEQRFEQLRVELMAHDKAKPVEVAEPKHDPEQLEAVEAAKGELEGLVEQTEALQVKITEATAELKKMALCEAAADRLLARIDNLGEQIETFFQESQDDADILTLETRELVSLSVTRKPIEEARRHALEQRKKLTALLDPALPKSLSAQRQELSELTTSARSKLDEPNRKYQGYLHNLAKWQQARARIEGSPDDPESLKGFEARLRQLNDLPSTLREKTDSRGELVKKIFTTKKELLEDYSRLHSPVQRFIDQHPISQRQGALGFKAAIGLKDFERDFFGMIHQGRKGSFQGEREGRERLRNLIDCGDFSTTAGVMRFLELLQADLTQDGRSEEKAPIELRDQLKQGKDPKDVYDFIYGLSYLKPRFELRWQRKPLDQLSPGERGSLLLVFYLLIDRRNVPLIIDQPEGNLDNQTVTAMVVPAIKYAMQRRQIVIVTHNPNLAVVCDADQVIHAELDKTDGNRVTYTSGAIEDPAIVQHIVNVLEGTKPAFDLRDAKYEVLESKP